MTCKPMVVLRVGSNNGGILTKEGLAYYFGRQGINSLVHRYHELNGDNWYVSYDAPIRKSVPIEFLTT